MPNEGTVVHLPGMSGYVATKGTLTLRSTTFHDRPVPLLMQLRSRAAMTSVGRDRGGWSRRLVFRKRAESARRRQDRLLGSLKHVCSIGQLGSSDNLWPRHGVRCPTRIIDSLQARHAVRMTRASVEAPRSVEEDRERTGLGQRCEADGMVGEGVSKRGDVSMCAHRDGPTEECPSWPMVMSLRGQNRKIKEAVETAGVQWYFRPVSLAPAALPSSAFWPCPPPSVRPPLLPTGTARPPQMSAPR